MSEPRDPFHAELMAHRMNLVLPAELDCRKSVVEYWLEEGEFGCRHVRTSYPIGSAPFEEAHQFAVTCGSACRQTRQKIASAYLRRR
jgi:hypothetical protein